LLASQEVRVLCAFIKTQACCFKAELYGTTMERHFVMNFVAIVISLLLCQRTLLASFDATTGVYLNTNLSVEFFYNFSCHKCQQVYETLTPSLIETFSNYIIIKRYDLLKKSDYERFMLLQQKLNAPLDADLYVFMDETAYLAGKEIILKELLPDLETLIAQKLNASQSSSATCNASHVTSTRINTNAVITALDNKSKTLDFITISITGLLDGINPCAFSTIVFLITLISISGRERQKLLLAGIGFCMAVFATYFVIGFGIFRALYQLTFYPLFARLLDCAVAALLIFLATLSFRDAFVYKNSANPHNIILKMPPAFLKTMHSWMRKLFSAKYIFLASMLAGFVVTLFESVCTGQLYLPALVYMASNKTSAHWYLILLIIYNFMFLLPLVLVFAAAYSGLTSETLLNWSRSNVLLSKTLIGCFMLLLALLIIAI
jgi:hypothetical protein